MFKISLLTDDRKLPKLLRALDGLIVGSPDITLLKGAEEVDGEVREVSETLLNGRTPRTSSNKKGNLKRPGATVPDKVMAILLKQKPPVITAKELREATAAAGASENSYTYVITALRKWGIMKGPTAAGTYNINEDAYHTRMASGE